MVRKKQEVIRPSNAYWLMSRRHHIPEGSMENRASCKVRGPSPIALGWEPHIVISCKPYTIRSAWTKKTRPTFPCMSARMLNMRAFPWIDAIFIAYAYACVWLCSWLKNKLYCLCFNKKSIDDALHLIKKAQFQHAKRVLISSRRDHACIRIRKIFTLIARSARTHWESEYIHYM